MVPTVCRLDTGPHSVGLAVMATANRIRALRKARGLTLEQLGELVGTTNQQISMLENGKRRLTTDWIEKLAKALNVRPSEIIEEPPQLTGEQALLSVADALGLRPDDLIQAKSKAEADPVRREASDILREISDADLPLVLELMRRFRRAPDGGSPQ